MDSMRGMLRMGGNDMKKKTKAVMQILSHAGDGDSVCIRTDFLYAAGYQNEPGYG